jgi:glycosyltransferase involved in cell wall biosynthesis
MCMTLTPVPVKVSVVVPTYCSGPGLDLVMSSLSAQTLAKDEFEVIFVDDGSTDATYDRLLGFAGQHPWAKVERIPNSGWPGRPRNRGVRRAAGKYVFFMDHDDYMFPDALRRMYDFAESNGLDVVHAKEVVEGWSTPAWRGFRREIPRGFDADTFDPITPHKLYRRDFLIEKDVWFREGRVRLEDIDFNVKAWMRTEAIGVMADYPAYKWILHPDNSHKVAAPSYWDDLRTAVQPLNEEGAQGRKRELILARIYRRQILDRLGPGLLEASAEYRARLTTVLAEQLPNFPVEVDQHLTPPHRARSALLRRADWVGLMELARADLGLKLSMTDVTFDWVDGQLELAVEGVIGDSEGGRLAVRREGDRIVRHLPDALADHFRDGELDLTDDVANAQVELVLRSRRDRVDWTIPSRTSEVWVQASGTSREEVRYRVRGRIDLGSAAFGAPLEQDRHDIFHRILGIAYTGANRVRVPEQTQSTALAQGSAITLTTSSAGFAVCDVGPITASAVAQGLSATPYRLAIGRAEAALDAPVDLPGGGDWSQDCVLDVSVYGLHHEVWQATLQAAGGRVTLHAEGPTPPAGVHRVTLRIGTSSAPIGWLSHDRPVGRAPTLRLLDPRAARNRARDIARDGRVPRSAKVRRRVRRTLGASRSD